MVYLDIGQ